MKRSRFVIPSLLNGIAYMNRSTQGNNALAGALGPWLMGLGFDRVGSYGPVLVVFLIATLAAIAAMLKLVPYRYRSE